MSGPGWRVVRCVLAALFAGPGAAMWSAQRDRTKRSWTVAGTLALLAGTGAAVWLLLSGIHWSLVAVGWAAFCGACGGVIGLIPGTEPQDPAPEPQKGSRPDAMVAGLGMGTALVGLLALVRVVCWWTVGGFVVRWNPGAADLEMLWILLILDALWLVPVGGTFGVVSLRRGRLLEPGDVAAAGAAWAAVLVVRELVIQLGLGALHSQLVSTGQLGDWGLGQALVICYGLGLAAGPLAYFLSWGTGRPVRRVVVTTLLMVVGGLNLAVETGGNAEVTFGIARALERSGSAMASMSWYQKSLDATRNQALAGYLHHRLGLLAYKNGDLDEARRLLRRLVAEYEQPQELVTQARRFAERLDAAGERVVLPGVEVATEARRSYCAPNTLALVLGFFGTEVPVAMVGEEIALVGRGSQLTDMRRLLIESGFELTLAPFSTLDDIRWMVDHGLPALVFTPGHVLAVFGYDDRLGTVVCYDTATWDIWVDRPFEDLESDWGREEFLLGIVLPTGDVHPAAEAARARFGGPRSDAAWYTAIADELRAARPEEAEALYRRALRLDPAYFPAAFALVAASQHGGDAEMDWIEEYADVDGIVALARKILERPRSNARWLAWGVSEWYWRRGQLEDLLELADAADRRGVLTATLPMASEAALTTGDPGLAVVMLRRDPEALREDAWKMETLVRASTALGDPVAGDIAGDIVDLVSDDRLEWAMSVVEQQGALGRPDRVLRARAKYAYWRSRDAEAWLDYAIARREALQDDGSSAQQRREVVRAAARIAAALGRGTETGARASELLASLDAGGK